MLHLSEIPGPEVQVRGGRAARGLLRTLHLDLGLEQDILEAQQRQAREPLNEA